MNSIIEIKNLNKSFGTLKAVHDLSITVQEGQLYAFLGINGAGKSTTISMMCGQLKKDSGEIILDHKNMETQRNEIKAIIGVVFQNSVLDSKLSVLDNLKNRAALYGIYGTAFQTRLKEISELLDLGDLLKRSVGKLSGGQRRRVDIARAIFHQPKILILDEPTTGLDPQTRKMVWNVITKLRRIQNMTVFLTTHYMEEASDADYIVIMNQGKIVAEGSAISLKNQYSRNYILLYHVSEEQVKALHCPYEAISNGFKIQVKDSAEATKLIVSHPQFFQNYEIIKGKMDDVFLQVTGMRMEAEG